MSTYPRPPLDDAEREALQNHRCGAASPDRGDLGICYCTRRRGHTGDHACGWSMPDEEEVIAARWPSPAGQPAAPPEPTVGCTRPDGLLNIHLESETCAVCAPPPTAPESAERQGAEAPCDDCDEIMAIATPSHDGVSFRCGRCDRRCVWNEEENRWERWNEPSVAASPPPVAAPPPRCRMGCGNLATHGPAGEAWACWQHAGDWPMVASPATPLPAPAASAPVHHDPRNPACGWGWIGPGAEPLPCDCDKPAASEVATAHPQPDAIGAEVRDLKFPTHCHGCGGLLAVSDEVSAAYEQAIEEVSRLQADHARLVEAARLALAGWDALDVAQSPGKHDPFYEFNPMRAEKFEEWNGAMVALRAALGGGQ